jgi:hypothetical protein
MDLLGSIGGIKDILSMITVFIIGDFLVFHKNIVLIS